MSATTLAVRERPIIFSGPMIRALLDGRKTQTRRVMKPQPPEWIREFGYTCMTPPGHISGRGYWKGVPGEEGPGEKFFPCPRGAVGDRLWVREAWQVWDEYANTPADSIPGEARLRINCPADGNPWPTRTRSPIFMPRWASRILLELTGVRVERVQEISEVDAIAEGVEDWRAYVKLWDALNAKRGYGWDVNPFCWALTFRRVTP